MNVVCSLVCKYVRVVEVAVGSIQGTGCFPLSSERSEQCKKDCSRSEQYTKRLSLYMCVCVCGCENKSHPEEFVK